jgi:hypothetical protein
MIPEPTPKEIAAIKAMKTLARRWPKTLWLFSASGTLCVMRFKDDGTKAYTAAGGVDPTYVADTIKIENDGGDW